MFKLKNNNISTAQHKSTSEYSELFELNTMNSYKEYLNQKPPICLFLTIKVLYFLFSNVL